MRDLFSDSKIQTTCLVVLTVSALTYLIYWLRPVLIPFAVALVVVSGISPILEGLERRLNVHRLVAAAITFVLGLVGLAILGLCLWLSVMQLASEGRAYRQRVIDLTTKVKAILELPQFRDAAEEVALPVAASPAVVDAGRLDETSIEQALAVPGQEVDERYIGDLNVADVGSGAGNAVAVDGTSVVERGGEIPFRRFLDNLMRAWIGQLSSELFSLLSTSVVVLIYVFFMLLGSVGGKQTSGPLSAINKQVRDYLALKTVISIVTGVAFGAVLWIFGVPMSLTFGLLAFLLNYIPNIGPIVASLLPVPLIVLQPDGSLLWMLSAISLAMTVQVVSGNIVEPKLMGNSADLHPVTILLALMFWGMLWGITGMFLATPMTAGLKIALEAIPGGKPFADLLAGRWRSGEDLTNVDVKMV